jgi:DNA-binding MarR family transcriptional regulator
MIVCCTDDCLKADCVQLTERESAVCSVICGSNGPVSFGRLREATSLHQEIVSRIVRRLVVHGLVRKTDDGYLGECGQ